DLGGVLQCECREKLEVDHGLREFVFSDCATPWLLPLELMPPPPPPRRRTLPLKRGPANATPATSLNVAVRIGLISGKTLVTVDAAELVRREPSNLLRGNDEGAERNVHTGGIELGLTDDGDQDHGAAVGVGEEPSANSPWGHLGHPDEQKSRRHCLNRCRNQGRRPVLRRHLFRPTAVKSRPRRRRFSPRATRGAQSPPSLQGGQHGAAAGGRRGQAAPLRTRPGRGRAAARAGGAAAGTGEQRPKRRRAGGAAAGASGGAGVAPAGGRRDGREQAGSGRIDRDVQRRKRKKEETYRSMTSGTHLAV
ncbi:hypothetical protein BRADI_3g48965v3, partial [Brachypodium distachyon]